MKLTQNIRCLVRVTLQFFAAQLLAFIWFSDVWLIGTATFLNGGSDKTYQTFSWLSYDWAALQARALPLWDFYTSSGQSHIGEMQPAALYPLMWLFSLVATPGDPWWINVFIIFHFGLALHFTVVLLRGRGMKMLPSAFGAIIYAFAGSVALRANAQANLFFGLAWMPLLLHGLLMAWQSERGDTNSTDQATRHSTRLAIIYAAIAGAMMILGGHIHALVVIMFASGVIALSFKSSHALSSQHFASFTKTPRFRALKTLTIVALLIGILASAQLFASTEYLKGAMKWYGSGATHSPHHVPFAAKLDFALTWADWKTLWNYSAPTSSSEVLSLYLSLPGLLFALIGLITPNNEFKALRRLAAIGALSCVVLATIAHTQLGKPFLSLPVLQTLRSPVRALHGLHLFCALLAAIGLARVLTLTANQSLFNRFRTNSSAFAIALGLCTIGITFWDLSGFRAYVASPSDSGISPQNRVLNRPLLDRIKAFEKSDAAMYRYAQDSNDPYSPNAGDVIKIRHTRSYRSSMPSTYFDFLSRDWALDGTSQTTLGARYILSRTKYPNLTFLQSDGDIHLYLNEAALPVLTFENPDQTFNGIAGAQADWQTNSVCFNWPKPISGRLRFAQVFSRGWYFRTDTQSTWAKVEQLDVFASAPVQNARSIEFAYRPWRIYVLIFLSAVGWLAVLVWLGLYALKREGNTKAVSVTDTGSPNTTPAKSVPNG